MNQALVMGCRNRAGEPCLLTFASDQTTCYLLLQKPQVMTRFCLKGSETITIAAAHVYVPWYRRRMQPSPLDILWSVGNELADAPWRPLRMPPIARTVDERTVLRSFRIGVVQKQSDIFEDSLGMDVEESDAFNRFLWFLGKKSNGQLFRKFENVKLNFDVCTWLPCDPSDDQQVKQCRRECRSRERESSATTPF